MWYVLLLFGGGNAGNPGNVAENVIGYVAGIRRALNLLLDSIDSKFWGPLAIPWGPVSGIAGVSGVAGFTRFPMEDEILDLPIPTLQLRLIVIQ